MRKKNGLLGILTIVLCSVTLFVGCNESDELNSNEIEKVSNDKQVFNVSFKTLEYEETKNTQQSSLGISGQNGGGYCVTSALALKSFLNPAPFISVYGSWEGENIAEDNVFMEINNSEDGINWKGWMKIVSNKDADLTSKKQLFNNIELDNSVKFVKFKINFTNSNASLNNAQFYFFNPLKTSPVIQELIDAEAEKISKEVALFEAEANGTSKGVSNLTLCAKPSFTSRSVWGARAAKSAPVTTSVNFIIVHHEDGANSSSDWGARVRSVQNFHMDSNGWADVGYNYLIAPNGVPFEGRGGGENVVGAHNCGVNAQTMGICMLGNYNSVLPTNNAQYSLKRLVAWKAKQRGINILSTGALGGKTLHRFTGHRGTCSTDCPGNKVWNQLPAFRSDIKTNFIDKCK